MWIGGNLDCSNTYDVIEEHLKAHTNVTSHAEVTSLVKDIREMVFATLKNLYRADELVMPSYCSMDTPFSACHAQCKFLANYTEEKVATSLWDSMYSFASSDSYTWLSNASKYFIIRTACEGGIGADGDQLESASPLDPSFWVIHPTLEVMHLPQPPLHSLHSIGLSI